MQSVKSYFVCLFTILCSSVCYSSGDVPYADWVYTVLKDYPETTLRDMVIPGTHDSGTCNLNASSDLSPDSPYFYALHKKFASQWARTQNFNFHEMLLKGIRHFDLRIQKHKGEFVLVHGLVGMKLEDALSQVKGFSDAHPMEPIILEVAKSPPVHDIGTMIDLFDRYVGSRRVDNAIPLSQVKLQDIWKQDQNGQNSNIIVVFREGSKYGQSRGYFDGRRQFTGTWANTEDSETLKSRLLHGSPHSSDRGLLNAPKDKLSYSAFTYTANWRTILTSMLQLYSPRGLLKWTEDELRPLMGEWVSEWADEGIRPNIITTDFFEYTALMPLSIALNQREPEPPAEKLHYKEATKLISKWSNDGTASCHLGDIVRPVPESGYSILGDIIIPTQEDKSIKTMTVKDDQPGVARPTGYNWIWNNKGMGSSKDVTIWRPIPPAGYVSLGDIVTNDHGLAPANSRMRCVHKSYLNSTADIQRQWDNVDSGGQFNVSLWRAENCGAMPLETFKASRNHSMPGKKQFWSFDPLKVVKDY
jgi:hypothetical protein